MNLININLFHKMIFIQYCTYTHIYIYIYIYNNYERNKRRILFNRFSLKIVFFLSKKDKISLKENPITLSLTYNIQNNPHEDERIF